MDKKCFLTNIFLSSKMFLDQQFFNLNFGLVWVSLVLVLFLFFWDQHFFNQIFSEQNFLGSKFLVGTNSFWDQNFGDQFYLGTKLYFLAQPLIRPSSRLTVSAWVSPSSTPAWHDKSWMSYMPQFDINDTFSIQHFHI